MVQQCNNQTVRLCAETDHPGQRVGLPDQALGKVNGGLLTVYQDDTWSHRAATEMYADIVRPIAHFGSSSVHTEGATSIYVDLGDCDQRCRHCGAMFWYEECEFKQRVKKNDQLKAEAKARGEVISNSVPKDSPWDPNMDSWLKALDAKTNGNDGAPMMLTLRGTPNPYYAPFYSTYMNDGYGLMGMAANGYNETRSASSDKLSKLSIGSDHHEEDVTFLLVASFYAADAPSDMALLALFVDTTCRYGLLIRLLMRAFGDASLFPFQ
ncbi:hypothetical protein Tco_1311203 [Tanacetum coccineum]